MEYKLPNTARLLPLSVTIKPQRLVELRTQPAGRQR